MNPRPAARRVLPSSPFAASSRIPAAAEDLEDGDRVTHDRHGLGTVLRVIDDYEAAVTFKHDSEGTSRIVSRLKLTKL
ncbi:hypothetical protein J2S57_006963 [Kineosporia succinea]|uniref:Uncharacterized protein n=1 Tax=Kineosporia succinea TaxID=84632 RepID=A0ABT9PET0_9ACTN|nr:hypothetical protein [Kineosporia succinea]MDP9831214.1 hypothetical protein [Kineosporia succinea]